MKTALFSITILFSMCINAQIITFNDANFKSKLTSQISGYCRDASGNVVILDANSDGEIDTTEALMCYQLIIENGNINDVTGIEYFTNLKTVKLKFNSIDTFNASTLINLEYLDLYLNGLQSLTLGEGLTQLSYLDCSSNQLTALDVTGCTGLVTLKCGTNNINGLVISDLPNLVTLAAAGYSQTFNTLTLNNLPALESVVCDVSKLTDLFLSGVENIKTFSCKQNSFTSLDFSMLTSVETIYASNNYILDYLNVKNGRNESVYFGVNVGHEALTYICADNEQISNIEYSIAINGMNATCGTSPYCNFTPGGNYYTITGQQRWDADNNGCSDADPLFDNFRIHTTKQDDMQTSFDIFSGSFGGYQLNLPEGTYTISPKITDNQNFFTITPASLTITLPSFQNPTIQDFCVTPNGNQNDVEVKILPLGVARPGFDSKYQIIFENKGNQTASGVINLVFNDAVLDPISIVPNADSIFPDTLQWDYVNLLPFERRKIELTFNVNSPTETPAVNIGEVLNYQASITSLNTDVIPSNNNSGLNQIVVGSYDPNDIVCLDGTTIGVSQVGKYVYYRIRFENTGTFPAEFVVVKNTIDSNVFDISSLTPVSSSHSFRTEIRYDDFEQTAEFIFENINLPFDDDNNDGYIIYKIKTKNNLTIGSTFSNNAKIYFDYNLPINTNTYTTTVTALNNNDFDTNAIYVWPNPADSVLYLSSENETIVKIYNMLGQLVTEQKSNNGSIDVSALKQGTYVIDILNNNGNSKVKFLKK